MHIQKNQKGNRVRAKKYGVVFLFIGLFITAPLLAQIPEGYELVWSDEFTGDQLNEEFWNYEVGPRRVAFNSRESVSVEDGKLVITTFHRNDTVLTGMINTYNKMDKKYGYFECRAKMQKANGCWSAFWLMPYNIDDLKEDPASHGVEIDVYEYMVRKGDRMQHALHWSNYKGNKRKMRRVKGIQEGYHTFSVLWTEDEYIFYIDGKESWRTNKQISQVSQPVLFSVEVGKWGGKIHRDELPDKVYFDYVRIYQKP